MLLLLHLPVVVMLLLLLPPSVSLQAEILLWDPGVGSDVSPTRPSAAPPAPAPVPAPADPMEDDGILEMEERVAGDADNNNSTQMRKRRKIRSMRQTQLTCKRASTHVGWWAGAEHAAGTAYMKASTHVGWWLEGKGCSYSDTARTSLIIRVGVTDHQSGSGDGHSVGRAAARLQLQRCGRSDAMLAFTHGGGLTAMRQPMLLRVSAAATISLEVLPHLYLMTHLGHFCATASASLKVVTLSYVQSKRAACLA